MKYLNRAHMKDGGVYAIMCRNAYVGVWREHCQGFIAPRNKFNDWYLFVEYHWDTGAPHGVAKPLAFIEDCPIKNLEVNKNHDQGLEYLRGISEKAKNVIRQMQEEENARVAKEGREKAEQMGIAYEQFEEIKYLKYKEDQHEQQIAFSLEQKEHLELLKRNGIEKYTPEGSIFTHDVEERLGLANIRLKQEREGLDKVRVQLAKIRKELEDEKES